MIELTWVDTEHGYSDWCLHPPLDILRAVVRRYPLTWVIA